MKVVCLYVCVVTLQLATVSRPTPVSTFAPGEFCSVDPPGGHFTGQLASEVNKGGHLMLFPIPTNLLGL